MSKLYVSRRDQVIANGRGPSARFRANVPRPLRASLVETALGQGIRPADGSAPDLPPSGEKTSAPTVEEIADAIRRIMARGESRDVTTSGQIRMNVLETELGHNIGAEDRDAAMALIEAHQEQG